MSKSLSVEDEVASVTDMMRCIVDTSVHMMEAGIRQIMIQIEDGNKYVSVWDSNGKKHMFLAGENRHSFAKSIVLG